MQLSNCAGSHYVRNHTTEERPLSHTTVISIIDDDQSVREAMRSLLKATGYGPETFASAEDFLRSQARYDELLQNYHKAVISAFRDVEDALVATRQTAIQEQRQQVAVNKAHLAYNISATQFRQGAVDMLTVLYTENALFPARDTLVQVKLARLQATVDMFKALGGGWQQPQGEVSAVLARSNNSPQ